MLAGAALLAALLFVVDLRRLTATVAGADWALLGAALAAAFVSIVLLEAARFSRIFAPWGLSYPTALRITLEGLFVGSFTPGLVGSDAYRLYAMGRPGGEIVRPLVLLVVLRLLGMAAVLTVAGGAALAEPARIGWPISGKTPALLGIGAAALLLLGLTIAATRKRFVPRVQQAFEHGRGALRQVGIRTVGELFALSLGIAWLRGLSLALLVWSLGEKIPIGDLLIAASLALLASVLPISPAGLGVQEGTIAGYLAFLGVPAPAAVAVALLSRAALWLFAGLGGLMLALPRKTSPGQDSGASPRP